MQSMLFTTHFIPHIFWLHHHHQGKGKTVNLLLLHIQKHYQVPWWLTNLTKQRCMHYSLRACECIYAGWQNIIAAVYWMRGCLDATQREVFEIPITLHGYTRAIILMGFWREWKWQCIISTPFFPLTIMSALCCYPLLYCTVRCLVAGMSVCFRSTLWWKQ